MLRGGIYFGFGCLFFFAAAVRGSVAGGDSGLEIATSAMQPMFVSPGGAACTATTCGTGTGQPTPYGTLGDVSRGLLPGPGLTNLDLSVNKDTNLHFLGEQGKLEFRAEMFNILNHANFGMPNGTVFSGAVKDLTPYSEAPNSTAGQIASTVTTSRQIQLALKVIF